MYQMCKQVYLASRCSDFKSHVIARAPKESQCEPCACIFVLVQSPVDFEGEFKAKLFCWGFFTEAFKGKGRKKKKKKKQVGYPLGSSGTLYPLQCVFQRSYNHSFAVLQDP